MVIEPQLEGDCSLAHKLLVVGGGVYLGLVHQAGDLTPPLEWVQVLASPAVATRDCHILLSSSTITSFELWAVMKACMLGQLE